MTIQQDLTPEEQQRLNEVNKQHKEQLQATSALEKTIKELSKNNARTKNESAFTDNRLEVRKYTDSVRDTMSSETSKLFEQLEDINIDSRKQSKHEQRDNLKQLDVLRELSKNIQDDEQKLQLQKFVDTTEESIKANSNRFTAFVSKSVDNFGDIGAVLSGLNDSPLLSMGFAYFGNKITDSLKGSREQSYQVQEGSEDQLFELLQQREQSAKRQETLLKELADRKADKPDNKGNVRENEFKVDNSSIEKELKLNNDELVSINDSINNLQNPPAIDHGVDSKQPIENIVNVENNLAQDLSKLTNDEVINQLDFANEQLLSIDDSVQKLNNVSKIDPTIESVVNNTINVPELDLSTLSLERLEELVNVSNQELLSIGGAIDDFLNSVISIDNGKQEPVQVPVNEDNDFKAIETQLININHKLTPLLNGLEERKRESELYNDQLLTALQDLKGKSSGVSGKEDSGSILGSVFGMLNSKALLKTLTGGFMKGFKSLGKSIARVIPKVLSKIMLPVAIVGALFSGVTEALDTFKKSGSVKDAVTSYFGGMLDFITFGLFDTNSLKSMGDTIKGYSQSLYDALTYPLEKMTDLVSGIMSGDWRKSLKAVFELNPIGLLVNGLEKAFNYTADLVSGAFDSAMTSLDTMVTDFTNSIADSFKIPDFDFSMPWDDDNKSKIDDKKTIKSTDLSNIGSARASIRESIGSVYKVNDIPMNKQDYKQASNAVLKAESSNAGGNNSFSNVNIANNNQTIVAPLPSVHNNDIEYIRTRSNNPY